MGMDDLLKMLLAGATGAAGQPQQPTESQPAQGEATPDLLGTLLSGLMGAGAGAQPAQPPQSAQAPQAAGGVGGLLGSLLGGGSASPLGPIVQTLAQKLGLPPAIAQAVVLFVISKLLPALLGGAAPQAQSAPQPAQPQAGGLDLGDLLGRMLSGNPRRLSAQYLQSTGLHAELAQQVGLDEDTALNSLREVFLTLGSTLSTATAAQPQPEPAPSKPAARPKPAPAKTTAKTAKKAPPKKRQPPEE